MTTLNDLFDIGNFASNVRPRSFSQREPVFESNICFSDGRIYENMTNGLSVSVMTDGVMDSLSWKRM